VSGSLEAALTRTFTVRLRTLVVAAAVPALLWASRSWLATAFTLVCDEIDALAVLNR
jgi:hypothetical protein